MVNLWTVNRSSYSVANSTRCTGLGSGFKRQQPLSLCSVPLETHKVVKALGPADNRSYAAPQREKHCESGGWCGDGRESDLVSRRTYGDPLISSHQAWRYYLGGRECHINDPSYSQPPSAMPLCSTLSIHFAPTQWNCETVDDLREYPG